jgi:hypothetical protein
MFTKPLSSDPTMHVGNRLIRVFLVVALFLPSFSFAQTQPGKQNDVSESGAYAQKEATTDSNAAFFKSWRRCGGALNSLRRS